MENQDKNQSNQPDNSGEGYAAAVGPNGSNPEAGPDAQIGSPGGPSDPNTTVPGTTPPETTPTTTPTTRLPITPTTTTLPPKSGEPGQESGL